MQQGAPGPDSRQRRSPRANEPADFDVMIVLDISGSTKVASGVDVDGDGEIGINPEFELVPAGVTYPEGTVSTDPGDTILAAEVKRRGRAAREPRKRAVAHSRRRSSRSRAR